MRKYIIFRADKGEPGWKERKLQHTQGLTRILAEHFDSSDQPIPELGYRPREFVRIDGLHNPTEHGYSTHYRQGDWEVTRVESYTPDVSTAEFDMIVICFCKYSPVNGPVQPMPERRVSIDSFAGDEKGLEQWHESQKKPTEV
ncbi:MAG: hypothetical protein P5702_14775 [Limnospira sp. PMC 1291.21]|uniref:Uncharacterized protein n=2 Tax=Limnospira TaxID=2596745 RepID=A0A9P1NYW7_9CYAN|nr:MULTISPECIES: hypothetical protein [Limnospira]MDC0836340.1 hypothetical protein [Limnoraphis robusta]MDY7051554.1 hypothetical protein [Limnospira fusiformis LS22]QJB26323.1 hypothetical protein HFV01_11565 [Limnospira fusiformis SAG 85.79]UWU48391.1 hypothetical protein APLC1_3185 [Arthrospira platensis C1]EDZ92585.1 conserved hypothetical protein [Limnospira maxima CS-328]